MARYGGSQCQRNFKYLCYLRGYKIRTFEFHRRPLEIPFAIKWRKVETSFPECKEERKEILRKSDIVVVPHPSSLSSFSHFRAFYPSSVFSFLVSLHGPFRCPIVPFSSLTPSFRYFFSSLSLFFSFCHFFSSFSLAVLSSGRCVWSASVFKDRLLQIGRRN